jgi:hypothetical protein
MDQGNQSHGVPYKSKLRPYVGQIRKWRRAGFTWSEIAEKLAAQGCNTHATNLCQFMRRYRKRPFPSGAEPEIPDVALSSKKRAKHVKPLVSKDTLTPYFEELVDEAREAARQAEERPIFNVVKATRPL